MIRKISLIAGGLAGLAYTLLGMGALYRNAPPGWGRMGVEFFVLAIFTVPLGASIGMGIGLLLDGLVRQLTKRRR